MDIAIGLPTGGPHTSRDSILKWAERAEQRGLAALVLSDRLLAGGYDTIVAATAAAMATETIPIVTSVILGPLRTNVASFAKQVASIDRLSGGRLFLGLGVGSREDDYVASEVDFHQRGKALDAQILRLREIFNGGLAGFGPAPTRAGGPPMLIGGKSDAALARVTALADGWICPTSAGPDGFARGAARIRDLWSGSGREGEPLLYALAPRFVLGPAATERAREGVRAYNAGHAQSTTREQMAEVLTTPAQVREAIAAFEAAGCGLISVNAFDANPDQVDYLADALTR